MLNSDKLKMLELFKNGIELYRKRDFSKAKAVFKKCLEITPDDGPSEVYIARCDEYIKNPPPIDWDGVFIMTKK